MITPQHAKIENFELFGMTVHMAPPGLWFYADSYLSAAKAVPLPATTDQFDPARVFLVLRGLELALKTFLSLKGRSLAKLAGGPFGHDLASLLARRARGAFGHSTVAAGSAGRDTARIDVL
jgi:hypothetical protein